MRVTRKNAKKGMRVILTHPQEHYSIGLSNPAVGSNWESAGVITSVGPGDDADINVNWDNGARNGYHDNTLTACDRAEGKCESIW